MWRWLYDWLFRDFVMELYDVINRRQLIQERAMEDLQKDVKRLYNMTTGTQALENLLEKKLATALHDIEDLKRSSGLQKQALRNRTLEIEQSIKAVENRVVDLYNTGLNLFNQIRSLQDRVDHLKHNMRARPSPVRRANALVAPRDSRGRFTKRNVDGQADKEAQ